VAMAAAVVASVSLWMLLHTKPQPAPIVRLSSELGADATLNTLYGSSVSLSPDGQVLAFAASKSEADRPQIYVRRLDQLRGAALVGTQGARNPFFSPDGQWIGFFAGAKLKKISVNGGGAVQCARETTGPGGGRGGAWEPILTD